MTGHADGVITVNIAEADDPERERRRSDARAVSDPSDISGTRAAIITGIVIAERRTRSIPALRRRTADYGGDSTTTAGPPADGRTGSSGLASAHPWEDWAEKWRNTSTWGTRSKPPPRAGLSLTPRRRDEPTAATIPEPVSPQPAAFSALIESWFPLTYVNLNNLNRGLGHPDAYPLRLITVRCGQTEVRRRCRRPRESRRARRSLPSRLWALPRAADNVGCEPPQSQG